MAQPRAHLACGTLWQLLHEKDQKLLESWDIRTYLSESEAKEWSAAASSGCGGFVVLVDVRHVSEFVHWHTSVTVRVTPCPAKPWRTAKVRYLPSIG